MMNQHNQEESKSSESSLSDNFNSMLESASAFSGKFSHGRCAWSMCILKPALNDDTSNGFEIKDGCRKDFEAGPRVQRWIDHPFWTFVHSVGYPSVVSQCKQSLHIGLFKKDDVVPLRSNYPKGGAWMMPFSPQIQADVQDARAVEHAWFCLISALQYDHFVHPLHLCGLVLTIPEGGRGGVIELWVKDATLISIREEIGKLFEIKCGAISKKCIIGFERFGKIDEDDLLNKIEEPIKVKIDDNDLLDCTIADIFDSMPRDESGHLVPPTNLPRWPNSIEAGLIQLRMIQQFGSSREYDLEEQANELQCENQRLRATIDEMRAIINKQRAKIYEIAADKIKSAQECDNAISFVRDVNMKLNAQLDQCKKVNAALRKQLVAHRGF